MQDTGLWKHFCEVYRHYPAVGIGLDISRMNVPPAFLQEMGTAARDALQEMAALEDGAIANPDEQRMVGHYWLRAPHLAPDTAIGAAITSTQRRIIEFCSAVRSGKICGGRKKGFRKIVVAGIGGSALGPQLVADALGSPSESVELLFCDNTDPDGYARLSARISKDLAQTLCVVISKSGGTVETRNAQLELAAIYSDAGLSFAEHAVAVTSEGSKLDEIASAEGWLDRFPMWDWVGGRTSLFSSVGLLPAGLMGVDTEQFLAGAAAMDVVTRNPELGDNPAMLLALSWFHVGEGRGKRDMVVVPYKDRLLLFSKYLQQLVMESLGKEKDRDGKVVHQGLAVYGNKGSTDQHAYIQQLRDGLDNFFLTFIKVLQDDVEATGAKQPPRLEVEPGITSGDYLVGFLAGTRRALHENGRPSLTIALDRLDAHALGALIALYERAVGFYASLININAYHQPGVEAGKKAAARVIELQQQALEFLGQHSGKQFSAEELAGSIGAAAETEELYHVLLHLALNGRVGAEQAHYPRKATFTLKR